MARMKATMFDEDGQPIQPRVMKQADWGNVFVAMMQASDERALKQKESCGTCGVKLPAPNAFDSCNDCF